MRACMQIEWVFGAQRVALLGYRDREFSPLHDGSSLKYNAALNLLTLQIRSYRYQVNVSSCGLHSFLLQLQGVWGMMT